MAVTATPTTAAASRPMTKEERKVILASSLGTVFEWYDFYLYGSLAVIIGSQFFSAFDVTTRNVFALLAFAAGFLVRPFGALVFGRLGDLVGRKYTFLVTIVIMGTSTFIVGLLPSYDQIGWIAPVILIVLRMAQGLALGGEYGGAAVYVAEHAPQGRRGFYTSWIQTTATVGLLLSLLVILALRMWMGEAGFQRGEGYWIAGWRIPFLLSIVLLAISVWIRLQMNESPAFQKMKEEGTQSKAPLSEAFGQWKNAKIVIIALLGLVVGQAVVWYTGQFYALFFLQNILKVDLLTANVLIAWSLILGTGGFIFFGALSDKIGRKPIILGGCLIAAITFFPLFKMLTSVVSPKLEHALATAKVQVTSDPAFCGSVFDPVGIRNFTQPCDIARVALARAAIKYEFVAAPAGTAPKVTFNGTEAPILGASPVQPAVPAAGTSPAVPSRPAVNAINANIAGFNAAATKVGYPAANDPTILRVNGFFDAIVNPTALKAIGILLILVLYVTAVYGPIAAALVESFPTRIRYTAMSLPYHIGNGWFGGLLPPTSFAMVAATGDIYYGLWYPVCFALMTFVIGLLFVKETKDRDIFAYQGEK
ncbi:MFS transporter [Enterovirga rhinocerotis]|uniref:Sugar transport protein n=1 Tax=Enterovirga rhinocerotis TaxID=1339210 RepID=A0A4V3DYL7_9HYPH|nr:MFS transporter [Enterovirga rhinocerotis]TDR93099.1 sugar transport protein [Enterovirga rhinocerotis]